MYICTRFAYTLLNAWLITGEGSACDFNVRKTYITENAVFGQSNSYSRRRNS